LVLNFSQVDYISSAGIRVLLKYYKQLKAARGTLSVVRPPAAVLTVLRLSGIAGTLVAADAEEAAASPKPAEAAGLDVTARRWDRSGVEFESHLLASNGSLEACAIGQPESFVTGNLLPAQSHRLRCATDVLAVGLGAFGCGPEDTRDRFGESLAVAGAAVTMPTDGSSVPDYQVTQGQLVPELHLLYGLVARGTFSRLLRFEAGNSHRGVISLGELIEAALLELESAGAAFAVLAESTSVIGATLQRSPTLASGQSALAFPAVRDWLSFTTERSDERNLVLVLGLAQRAPHPELAACLRPVGPGTDAHGHFHAAVFPYRPLPKGRLDLPEALAQVLATESAQTVLHLLADEREFEGVGQTDFMRGACWVGPLSSPHPPAQS
jgi:hypothetical protein